MWWAVRTAKGLYPTFLGYDGKFMLIFMPAVDGTVLDSMLWVSGFGLEELLLYGY